MRTAEITLVNRGIQTATYRISFQNMQMTGDGRLEEIKVPGPVDRPVEEMIRYSPRQVVLEPGESQTVRLLVRKPRDLPPGEYRSHLLFRALPPQTAGENIETLDLVEGNISVRLTAIYGISIPIIVRHGDISADVTLSDMKLEPGKTPEEPPALVLRLNRSGAQSTFGDVAVTFTETDGAAREVGLIRGIAIYAQNDSRSLRLPLAIPAGLELKQGHLIVVYRDEPEDGSAVLAEAELALP